MKLTLHGGVGEKGRTCVGIEQDDFRLLLDVGVNTSAPRDSDRYYPAISSDRLATIDAILITHAHEDHAAALGWCVQRGFKGRVFMSAAARDELDATLAGYATPAGREAVKTIRIESIEAGDNLSLGPFVLKTGRSGHVVGGVWCHVSADARSVLYCGDVVPASPVLAMDAPPACDLILIDASYGDDNVPSALRSAAVRDWVRARPEGSVLPTPLSGRSLELLAVIEGPIAVHASMRAPLAAQIAARGWLAPGAADRLSARLAQTQSWEEGKPLPRAALLCHDGMGLEGPSRAALERAEHEGRPVLLTGHLPAGSPGQRMRAAGKADWLRLPTHPTLAENIALIEASGATRALAHSCDPDVIATLKPLIPMLAADATTGDALTA
ncbi:MAG: hypothetical protein BGP06_20990 [Rhizobiales bacterium 65-9]|nr:MBL fold metallo-hydrolase [Hyphomicrobiales bacterium]OJY36499.1 MAG: hypothetical protein BGP06_20990 [Rhizobiales bacterium 65-9]